MNEGFLPWLQSKYPQSVAAARLSNVLRIEDHYGDLEDAFRRGTLGSVAESLRYTKADQRRGVPNPSKIQIDGDVYNGLATLRSALELYRKYLTEVGNEGSAQPATAEPYPDQRLSLEVDLQKALRRDISEARAIAEDRRRRIRTGRGLRTHRHHLHRRE